MLTLLTLSLFLVGKDDNKTKRGARVEIAKKELLGGSKDDTLAQAANYAWNKFNNIINNRVRFFHSEGKVNDKIVIKDSYANVLSKM